MTQKRYQVESTILAGLVILLIPLWVYWLWMMELLFG